MSVFYLYYKLDQTVNPNTIGTNIATLAVRQISGSTGDGTSPNVLQNSSSAYFAEIFAIYGVDEANQLFIPDGFFTTVTGAITTLSRYYLITGISSDLKMYADPSTSSTLIATTSNITYIYGGGGLRSWPTTLLSQSCLKQFTQVSITNGNSYFIRYDVFNTTDNTIMGSGTISSIKNPSPIIDITPTTFYTNSSYFLLNFMGMSGNGTNLITAGSDVITNGNPDIRFNFIGSCTSLRYWAGTKIGAGIPGGTNVGLWVNAIAGNIQQLVIDLDYNGGPIGLPDVASGNGTNIINTTYLPAYTHLYGSFSAQINSLLLPAHINTYERLGDGLGNIKNSTLTLGCNQDLLDGTAAQGSAADKKIINVACTTLIITCNTSRLLMRRGKINSNTSIYYTYYAEPVTTIDGVIFSGNQNLSISNIYNPVANYTATSSDNTFPISELTGTTNSATGTTNSATSGEFITGNTFIKTSGAKNSCSVENQISNFNTLTELKNFTYNITPGFTFKSSLNNNNTSVTSITLGSNISQIQANTFSGCTSLRLFFMNSYSLINPPIGTPLGSNSLLGTNISAEGYNNLYMVQGFTPSQLRVAGLNVVCFNENTKIMCLVDGQEKELLIQNIRNGVLVKTLRSGYKPVCMIGTSQMYNPGTNERFTDRLYICKKEKYPELNEDLIITGCHSILVDDITAVQREKIMKQMKDIYVTEGKYRLNANLDDRAEPYNCAGKFNIYHIALENEFYIKNYGVYANGLLVESCSKRYLKELSNMRLL